MRTALWQSRCAAPDCAAAAGFAAAPRRLRNEAAAELDVFLADGVHASREFVTMIVHPALERRGATGFEHGRLVHADGFLLQDADFVSLQLELARDACFVPVGI